MLRENVGKTRTVYQAVLRSKVSDDAPLDQQHAWWRIHDGLKREHAIADWQWESLILKSLIALVLMLGVLSVFVIQLAAVAVLVMGIGLWRCYVIFTRSAPD